MSEMVDVPLPGRVWTTGGEEASSLRGSVGIDAVSEPVDDDVMVEPTQCCEILGVGGATLGCRNDVVNFQPVA